MSTNHEVLPAALKIWERRVAAAIRVREPQDVAKIARLCAEAVWRGDSNYSVQHLAAEFYGTPCQCHACEPS